MSSAPIRVMGRGQARVATRRVRRHGRRDRVAALCWLVIAVAAGLVAFGNLVAPYDPSRADILSSYSPISASHWLGTDATGHDIFSELLAGARTSLLGPLCVIVIGVSIGAVIGVAAAWKGGTTDQIIARTLDAMFAFPGVLLAILAVAVFGRGLVAPVIALALAYIPFLARITRAGAIQQCALPYVDALRVQGYSWARIWVWHIFPNLIGLLVAQATIAFGYAVVDLAAISFLGLGVQPPTPDWGLMVANGETGILLGEPNQAFAGGLAIVVVVMAVNVLGERLAAREAPELL